MGSPLSSYAGERWKEVEVEYKHLLYMDSGRQARFLTNVTLRAAMLVALLFEGQGEFSSNLF